MSVSICCEEKGCGSSLMGGCVARSQDFYLCSKVSLRRNSVNYAYIRKNDFKILNLKQLSKNWHSLFLDI